MLALAATLRYWAQQPDTDQLAMVTDDVWGGAAATANPAGSHPHLPHLVGNSLSRAGGLTQAPTWCLYESFRPPTHVHAGVHRSTRSYRTQSSPGKGRCRMLSEVAP